MPSQSIEHNHEPTQALSEGLELLKAKPLPLLIGGLLEFLCWVAIPAGLLMTAQQAYGGGAKVALWAVAILLSAFLFVTHAWIRQGLILVQHNSIEGKPGILDSAIQNELPRPFIQWRLLALGVYGLAFLIGILPGGFVGFIGSSVESEILTLLGQTLAVVFSAVTLTAAHIALCFGDRLVVLSHIAPKAAFKHSANLAYKAKTSLLMLLIVGLALRIIGALFCGVGVPLAEILLDVSLTKAYHAARQDIEATP